MVLLEVIAWTQSLGHRLDTKFWDRESNLERLYPDRTEEDPLEQAEWDEDEVPITSLSQVGTTYF